MKYIDEFLKYIKYERNYSELTILNYSKDLNEFVSIVNKDMKSVKKDDVKLYLKVLYDHDNKSSSVSRKISSLKSFYKFMKLKGYVVVSPLNGIKYPKKEKLLPNFLPYNELEDMMNISKEGVFGDRDYLILELMYSTGVRVSELVNIKLSDIDFSGKQIRILGKGSYERIVFYGEYCEEILNKYIKGLRIDLLKGKDSEFLILNKNGDKITTRGIFKIIDGIINKTCIKTKVSPHTLRHTFATHLLDNGCDLRSVQELLGHKNINSTEVYTHITSERLKEVYFKSFPRGRER